jgi:hypothetical protein
LFKPTDLTSEHPTPRTLEAPVALLEIVVAMIPPSMMLGEPYGTAPLIDAILILFSILAVTES